MRVLVVQNRYRIPGGEDRTVAHECEALVRAGHSVRTYEADNVSVPGHGELRAGLCCLWNRTSYRQVRELARAFRPAVVSVHNFFPLISPSVLYAAQAEGVPVVQHLHNYRLLCPAATFYRAGKSCHLCPGRNLAWPALRHACYRGSRSATAAVAAMTGLHSFLGTWERQVTLYISPSQYLKVAFVNAGFDPESIIVAPHFVMADPNFRSAPSDYVLYAGRLSVEKGITTLMRAWDILGRAAPRLVVAGQGPLEGLVRSGKHAPGRIEFAGWRDGDGVVNLMAQARFLIVPSECEESFGRVVIESYAGGTPVIASDSGALPELVEEGRTGLLFRAGDAEDLADKVSWMLAHPQQVQAMRREARAEYEAKYTAEHGYRRLMDVFERAIAIGGRKRGDA